LVVDEISLIRNIIRDKLSEMIADKGYPKILPASYASIVFGDRGA